MKKRKNKLYGKRFKTHFAKFHIDPVWGRVIPPEYNPKFAKELRRLMIPDRRKMKRWWRKHGNDKVFNPLKTYSDYIKRGK